MKFLLSLAYMSLAAIMAISLGVHMESETFMQVTFIGFLTLGGVLIWRHDARRKKT